MERRNPLEPALNACDRLRKELSKRIGKTDGYLNQSVLQNLDTIEATLLQVVPLGDMMRVLNQQTEVAVNSFRSLDRLALVAADRPDRGDDGDSDTKGM